MLPRPSRSPVRLPAACLARMLLCSALAAAPANALQDAGALPTDTAPPVHDRALDNLGEHGLALQGYDPVAYFPEGGGEPRQGRAEFSVTLRGATYRFADARHKQLFLDDPRRYEPAFGGWCAYAMAEGDRVSIDPESFLIEPLPAPAPAPDAEAAADPGSASGTPDAPGAGDETPAPARLLLFYDSFFADTRARWLKRPDELRPLADAAWAKLTAPPKR